MHKTSMILDGIMDEDVIYTCVLVAVSSVVTIVALYVGYKFVIGKQKKISSDSDPGSSNKEAKPGSTSKAAGEGRPGDGENRRVTRANKLTATTGSQANGDKVNEKDESEDTSDEDVPELVSNTTEEKDPFEYCEHIQGEVKKIRQNLATKKIKETMTEEQLQEERDAQRKQLEAIFSMMATENDKFGIQSVDDIKTQMKLYV